MASLHHTLERELRILESAPGLSATLRQGLTARAAQFEQQAERVKQVPTPSKLPTQTIQGVLVMRPGIPPRPLDPFFFEIIRKS